MKWTDFDQRMLKLGLPVFTLRQGLQLAGLEAGPGRIQFARWTKRGLLLRLKNGLYALRAAYERGEIPLYYVAGQIYYPSYVSLESALSFYGLIPDTAFHVTSVTTRPTRRFEAAATVYTYRTVRPRYFTGYLVQRHQGFSIRIAEKEKAVVDHLYFAVQDHTEPWERLQTKGLNSGKLLAYARLNGNRQLIRIVEELC